jgi:hypothetical protein
MRIEEQTNEVKRVVEPSNIIKQTSDCVNISFIDIEFTI